MLTWRIIDGTGSTGEKIAQGRNFVGIELNPEYVKLARQRIGRESPLLAREIAEPVTTETEP